MEASDVGQTFDTKAYRDGPTRSQNFLESGISPGGERRGGQPRDGPRVDHPHHPAARAADILLLGRVVRSARVEPENDVEALIADEQLRGDPPAGRLGAGHLLNALCRTNSITTSASTGSR